MAEPAATPAVSTCWCGGVLGPDVDQHYQRCTDCGAAVLTAKPAPAHFDVANDARDFYGQAYWTEYSRARNLPAIEERARGDLSERCAFWLERLVEVVWPPGRALEIGCGHGGFVRLLRELGFDAVGTELSPWVVEYARRTFDVPVLQGPLEKLALAPGFACIAAFDVLEHLEDPLDTARRCADLLAPDGVLVLQTPWYRGEGADWAMLQADEHIHLFTEASIRLLLRRAGFRDVRVEPSLFPYDMWVVAWPAGAPSDRRRGDWLLPSAFRALLDATEQRRSLEAALRKSEADRDARLEQVETLTAALRKSEADRRADADELGRLLRESEADRAARLEQVEQLTGWLAESEADRAARLEVIRSLESRLEAIERTLLWRVYKRLAPLASRGPRR
jgi:2-polyprenyl-3-methyl-5-hydroxy-6-metoxy-1,4-benzoquinol methylase